MAQVLAGAEARAVGDDAAGTALAADAPLAAADAFCSSLARNSRTRMVKFATRLWSRGVKATEPAVISTSSGLVSQGLL
jgi:hypothetical protein